MHPASKDAYTELEALTTGFQRSAFAYLAVRSGIVDALAAGALSQAEIAAATALPDSTLGRTLRALTAINICRHDDGCFSLTAVGELLTQESDSPLRAGLLVDVEQRWLSWQQLPLAVRTGEPVFAKIHGATPWEVRAATPRFGADFNHWLALETRRIARQILPQLPLQGSETIADIGGGHGGLLEVVLDAYPHCNGVLFDLPHVISQVAPLARDSASRLQHRGGDFLKSIDVRADVFILKSVLHDWSDSDCRIILANCRAAMTTGQRLLVIERCTDDDMVTLEHAMVDMRMLLLHGGCERSRAACESLLRDSGFRPVRSTRTPSGFSIIESVACDETAA